MLYKQINILLYIMNNITKIKECLVKYNNIYPNINSTNKIEKLCEYIANDSKINLQDIKDIIPKYSYIFSNNFIFDFNYKTNNNYDDLLKLFNTKSFLPIRHNDTKNQLFGPYSSYWIHDIQINDDVSKPEIIRRQKQFDKLNSIKYPEQRSPEWFAQRDGKITASDAGVVLNENKYEQPYRMIVKKTRETFQNNPATYHGKKYEDIAKLIYEYRMNVQIHEFGMCEHPYIGCLGASPDGIVTPYKNDGIHLTELVGRMLEIKVPLMRQIQKTGEIKGGICPIYYWDQVQLQLECCDLDECDFWQCTLEEYSNWDMFLADTCKSEPFRSKTTSFEKGVIIQLLPQEKNVPRKHPDYLKIVYEYAKFIHPPKIEMTPEDCLLWIDEQIKKINVLYPNYVLDRVIYWYLKTSHCVTIQRDKKWFDSIKHKYIEMWDYITFVRKEPKYKELFLNFVDATQLGDKDYDLDPLRNKIIFRFLDRLNMDEKDINIKTYDLINNNLDKYKNINKKEKLKNELNILYDKLNEILD
jgi:putative phage-type endonuclease